MTSINNRSWQPNDWNTIKSMSKIVQTLERTNPNSSDRYKVNMKFE
jgi:hypothetical protein